MEKYRYIFKRTCYLSRWKQTDLPLVHWNEPMTFHSLCAKIFATIIIENPTCELYFQLEGDNMRGNVKKALEQLKLDSTSNETNKWVLRIREHLNSGKNLKEYHNGPLILEIYLVHKGEALDWEDSFHYAKHYLDKNEITKIRNFDYEYIILVDTKKLNVSNNNNAVEFIDAFKEWNARNTKKNIYQLDDVKGIQSVEIFNDTEEEFKEVFIDMRVSKEEFDDSNIVYLEDLKEPDEDDLI